MLHIKISGPASLLKKSSIIFVVEQVEWYPLARLNIMIIIDTPVSRMVTIELSYSHETRITLPDITLPHKSWVFIIHKLPL